MAIYVMHLLPLAGLRILLLKILHFKNLWINVVVITIFSIVFCIIMKYILDKLKISKYLFGNF